MVAYADEVLLARSPKAACRRRSWCPHRAARHAAVAVEVALTSTILLLFVLAGLEFGRMNMLRHTLNNAAYEGARRALVPKATDREVQEAVQRLLRTVAARDPRIRIQRSNGTVTVQVELDARQQGWMVPRYFRSRTLQSSVTLVEDGS